MQSHEVAADYIRRSEMTIVTEDGGWIDDEGNTCRCGAATWRTCNCAGTADKADEPSEPTDEVIDRMMTDEKFYDNIVGYF
jgi:hypothetical protein